MIPLEANSREVFSHSTYAFNIDAVEGIKVGNGNGWLDQVKYNDHCRQNLNPNIVNVFSY